MSNGGPCFRDECDNGDRVPLSTRQVSVTEAMLAVGSASQVEFCTRVAGVEVLLILAERIPAIMRKCSTLAPGLLPLALALACEVIIFPLLFFSPIYLEIYMISE